MLGHFLVVLGQVGTLFLLMAAGYVLGRKKWLSGEGITQISTILLYLVAPCIMIETLQIERTPEVIRTLLAGTLVNVGFYLAVIAASFLFFGRQPAGSRPVLRFGVSYGNVGFMGLPLLQAVLGEEAVLLCVINIVVFNIAQWSHGVAIMGGNFSARRALLNPATVSAAAGMSLFLFSVRLPAPVLHSVGYFADLNTPLAMLVIGAQMSQADMKQIFMKPILYAGAAVKLILVPAATALLLLPFRLDGLLYSVCVILAAAPSAGTTGIFAQRFGRDTATAAQLITLSTLLSAFTLPAFAVIAQRLAG